MKIRKITLVLHIFLLPKKQVTPFSDRCRGIMVGPDQVVKENIEYDQNYGLYDDLSGPYGVKILKSTKKCK